MNTVRFSTNEHFLSRCEFFPKGMRYPLFLNGPDFNEDHPLHHALVESKKDYKFISAINPMQFYYDLYEARNYELIVIQTRDHLNKYKTLVAYLRALCDRLDGKPNTVVCHYEAIQKVPVSFQTHANVAIIANNVQFGSNINRLTSRATAIRLDK